jgi:hypothetical protein
MTTTPAYQVLAQNEMRELYHNRGMEAYLLTCVKEPVPSPFDGTPAQMMHEVFCCKKRTFRYINPVSQDEVALISYVTPTPPNPKAAYIIVTRLVIDGVRYEAELPMV